MSYLSRPEASLAAARRHQEAQRSLEQYDEMPDGPRCQPEQPSRPERGCPRTERGAVFGAMVKVEYSQSQLNVHSSLREGPSQADPASPALSLSKCRCCLPLQLLCLFPHQPCSLASSGTKPRIGLDPQKPVCEELHLCGLVPHWEGFPKMGQFK